MGDRKLFSDTVKIMDASPEALNFSEATFKLDRDNRNMFVDRDNNIAAIPFWKEGEKLGVLVTNTERSESILKIAINVQQILEHYQQSEEKSLGSLAKVCIESFKKLDFISCNERLKKAGHLVQEQLYEDIKDF